MKLTLLPFQELVAVESLQEQALALAIDLKHPVYDCFYLALAERENAPLVTADEAMIAAARKAKIKAGGFRARFVAPMERSEIRDRPRG